jgi:VanZ family protein
MRDANSTRRFSLSGLLLAVYWLALLAATLSPSLPRIESDWKPSDKLLHTVAFAPLSYLLAYWWLRGGTLTAGTAIRIVAVVALFGVVDELLQIPIPGRTADVVDCAANTLGALAGAGAYMVAAKFTATRSPPGPSTDAATKEIP